VVALVSGVLAFLVAYLWNWASLKKVAWGKQVIALLGFALHGYAIYAACWGVGVDRFALPAAVSWLGWSLLPVSAILLIYSWFIELPVSKTYVKPGVGSQLVTTGTWALTRHPGVLWYALGLIALLLATRSTVLLICVPVWIVMNIIYGVMEDVYFFPRMFPDYPQYKQQTPMLIPTRRSIAACLKTLRAKEAL